MSATPRESINLIDTFVIEDCPYHLEQDDFRIIPMDRFGNAFCPEDITIPGSISTQSINVSAGGGCSCADGSGIFELTFEDVCQDRDYGFSDNILGAARRAVVCRVFADLSVLLNPTGAIPANHVRIIIQASEGQGVNAILPNTLAQGGPIIYSGFSDGITPGMVMRAIQSNTDPYDGLSNYDPNLSGNQAHGVLRVNFAEYNFFLNTTITAPVPNNLNDLYSTVLHESLHILGLYSLIDATAGNSSRLTPWGSPFGYSKYDTHIRTRGGINLTLNNSPNYINYPTAIPYQIDLATNTLIQSPFCSADAEYAGNALTVQELYLPFPWKNSGLSHLNCDNQNVVGDGCALNNGYVMNSCGPPGYNQRHPAPQEVSLLCDLGYQLADNFGTTSFAGLEIIALAGTLILETDGDYTFAPNPGYTGSANVVYTVNDSNGNSTSANLIIQVDSYSGNITYANEDAQFGIQGQSLTGSFMSNDYDPEGDDQDLVAVLIDTDGDGVLESISPVAGSPITVYVDISGMVSLAGVIEINPETGDYLWNPEIGFIGTVPFEYTVTDGNGESTATLLLTTLTSISSIITSDDHQQATHGFDLTGNVLANDVSQNLPLSVGQITVTNENGKTSEEFVNGTILVYGVLDAQGSIPFAEYLACKSGECLAIGVNDVLTAPFVASTSGPALEVPANEFISNDINTAGYVPASFEMLETNIEVGAIFDLGGGAGFSFLPTGAVLGWGVARYLPLCADGTPGDWAYIFIPIQPSALCDLPCPPTDDCNLICDGSFEGILAGNDRAAHYDFKISILGLALGSSVTPDLYSPENNYNVSGFENAICEGVYPNGILAPEMNAGNAFIGLETRRSNMEAWEFCLKKELNPAKTYQISFLVSSGCEINVNLGFSRNKACPFVDDVNLRTALYNGATLNCEGYPYSLSTLLPINIPTTISASGSNPVWERYILEFSPTEESRYLLLFMDLPIVTLDNYYAFFDDLSLIEIPNPPITITHELTETPCPGGIISIPITVCSEEEPGVVTLEAFFQSFDINYGNGGDFVNGESVLSNFIQIGEQFCQTAVLELLINENTAAGSSFEITIDSDGACLTTGDDYFITFTAQNEVLNAEFTFQLDEDDCLLTLIPDDPLGEHTWLIDGVIATTEISPVLELDPAVYTVTHVVTGICGIQEASPQFVDLSNCGIMAAFTCPCEGENALNIDAGDGEGTLVSTLIGNGTLPSSNLNDNTCLAIRGNLIIDIPLFAVNGGEIKMQPGAAITVNPGQKLYLTSVNEDTDGDQIAGIHGCGQLWEGIAVLPTFDPTISNGGTIILVNSFIQDAVHALKLENGAIVQADYNTFDRNHIGILVPESINPKYILQPTGPLKNNTFSCTSNLLPPFNGQMNPTNTWGKSGIEVYNCKFFEVGTTTRANFFSDTEQGIYAEQTALKIIKAIMHNMRSNPYNPANTSLGTGIKIKNKAILELSRSQFYNLKTAVIGHNIGVFAKENTLGRDLAGVNGNLIDGFDLFPYSGAKIHVDDNLIYAQQYGIRVRNVAAARELRISSENNIILTPANPGLTAVAGISLEDGLSASPENDIAVFSNIIVVQERGDGLVLNNISGAEVFDNEIGFKSSVLPNASKYGILLNNANDNYLYDNRVFGETLTGNHHGIYIKGSTNNRLCCNTLDGTSFGIYYDGTCDNTRMRHNTFNSNNLGLTCFLNTRIGTQIAAGNMWSGTFSSLAAAHYSTNVQDVVESRFFVAPPPGSTIWPTNIFVASGGDWLFQGATAPTCASDDNCEAPDELLVIDPDFSIKVARNQFSYGTYPVASQWEAQRALYRDQKRAGEPVVAAWAAEVQEFFQKQSEENTTLYRLGQLEDNLTSLYPHDDQLEHAQTDLQAYSEQLLLLDSFYLDGGMDSLVYYNERSILSGKIGSAFEEITTLASALQQLRTATAQSLLIENAAFASEHLPAANQQAINEYYLQTLAMGLQFLPPTLENKLRDIAAQCPYSGGHAVYRAQSILKTYNKDFVGNDCGIQAMRSTPQRADEMNHEADEKVQLQEESEVKVFPNPSSGLLTVLLPNSKQSWQINLLNLQGQLVHASTQSAIKCTLDYSTVPPGVYLLQAKSQEKTISKLVILQ